MIYSETKLPIFSGLFVFMVNYELMVALAEKESEESQKKLIKEIEANIEKTKGTTSSSEALGKKTLAFPIEGSSEGFYWLVNFEASAETPKKINDQLRIEDSVLRYLITRIEEVKKVSKKKSKVKVEAKKSRASFIR